MLGLGDLLHADNARNMTERSGNILDVDTRYAKTTTTDLLVEVSEMSAAKHDLIEIVLKPGNHDPNSTVGLVQGQRMYWGNSNRTVAEASVVYIDHGLSSGMKYGIAAAEAAGRPVEISFAGERRWMLISQPRRLGLSKPTH